MKSNSKFTRAISLKIRSMVMVNLLSRVENCIKGNGRMISNMDRELL